MFLSLRGKPSKVKASFIVSVFPVLRYLWNPFDLRAIANDGMAIAVFFKLNVPEVQDTSNNSKEMLITRDIPLENRLPRLHGTVLIFPTQAIKQNIGHTEGGKSDNLLQRYTATSCHHTVPSDRALHPLAPSVPLKLCPIPSLTPLPSKTASSASKEREQHTP